MTAVSRLAALIAGHEEEWRSIPGWDGLYEVSSLARIRSLDRVIARPGVASYVRKGRVMRQSRGHGNVRKYFGCVLSRANGGGQVFLATHRAVAMAFHGIPQGEDLLVRHLNDDPTDNRPENLAWGTMADNSNDMYRNGHHPSQQKTHCKKGHALTPDNTVPWRSHRVTAQCRECVREYERDRNASILCSAPTKRGGTCQRAVAIGHSCPVHGTENVEGCAA